MATTTIQTTPPALVPGQPPRARKGRSLATNRGGFWFVLPFFVVYAVFLLWPVVYGLGMSFFDTSLARPESDFVGLANYRELLGDPLVWRTLGHTLLFTVMSTIPLVLVALLMALLVQTGVRGQWLWRFSFFAPFLMPVATVVLIWQWLFQYDFGFINATLGQLGLEPVGWLTTEEMAIASVVILTVWWTVGFNFLLYLSALQAIPESLYEAAALDGAGGWRRLVSITLPLLSRTTGLVIVLQVLASLKVFDQIYILFGGGGGPDGAAAPLLQYVYDTGFVSYRLGYASAISYMFFALIIVFSLGQLWLSNRRGTSQKGGAA
ncbi:multiple sugar transport system permease protein [Kineococcus xinjiangensis]|uniref:Multiple sugar transport system permease protein n=1 Tax=Kineococcus xinjiangensis TaxID=512762 RepID=A0A2S6IT61_9ACTN|nr:sugar ABC transporter permease [Kineococcus xinjiangensis]PPK97429.1 multiple sugar transport system permease protein [Kineococcus xinjiangensis]